MLRIHALGNHGNTVHYYIIIVTLMLMMLNVFFKKTYVHKSWDGISTGMPTAYVETVP